MLLTYMLPLFCRKCRQMTLQTYMRRFCLVFYRCPRCGKHNHFRLSC